MKKSALLFFAFFLSLISYFLFLPPAFAQTPPSNTNPDVPNNLHNWTQNVMIEVMSALTCQLAGVDPINPKQGCLGINSASGKIGFVPMTASGQANGGAIGFMGNMIATLYTPPLHTSDYFQNLAQNFGINKNAYAQSVGGTGFQGLTPLIGIWSAFRNIVYLFLVIVFVVIGLAIMLRVKIDPRTVMTIQNQIPKIIIGILVVTFSFAIAGFLIDMMWVFIYLIYGIFTGISPEVAKSVAGLNPVTMQGSSPFGALGAGNILSIVWNASLGVAGVIASILGGGGDGGIGYGLAGGGVGAALGALGFLLNPIVGIITTVLGATALAEVGNTVGLIGGIIAFLIILIAVLVALFRLWFTLIIAYVHILIDVVLAPFWIIGGIVPGSPISLNGWLRDLIANLAAFPAVIGLFLLGKVFMDAFGKTPATGQNFVPPLIGNPGDPSLIGSLIGLGIILMAPNVVNMLKTALKAPKIDTGVSKTIGAGAALPVNVGRNIGGTLVGSEEILMRKQPGGGYNWGERGIAKTVLGRFFGR